MKKDEVGKLKETHVFLKRSKKGKESLKYELSILNQSKYPIHMTEKV